MMGIYVLILALTAWAPARAAAVADDGKPAAQPEGKQDGGPSTVAPVGDDVTPAFVPLHPRTAEDRQYLEALDDYVAARALEARGQWAEAIGLLQQALAKAPEATPILRRLSRLCYVRGRTDEAVRYAQRVLGVEPGDTAMISLLLEYHLRKDDPAGAEALLRKAIENPKLEPASAGALLIQRGLGDLYAAKLNQPEKAADAYAKVVEALDQKAATRLAPSDLRRILGNDEADAYARFGGVFFDAKRYELAISAFRRGLVYNPEHADLPRYLALSLLRAGQPDAALTALDRFLKRQPQGREPYELLIEVLTSLKRTEEVLPRLEAAARNDPKNAPLQYMLADRYREAGQREKAEELYKQLLATQPDPQGFGALSASLYRDKKVEELIKVLGDAFAKPDTLEAVKPQIEAIVSDGAFVDQMLDAGLKLQEADPPKLSREARLVLTYIATKAKKLDKLIPIQRIALRREPSPQAYREFWFDLYRNGKYEEAAATLGEMLTKYPAEKTSQILGALAQSRVLAGMFEPALGSAEEALKLDPNDKEALRLKGFVLGRLGRNDEAIAVYRTMLQKFPTDDEVIKRARSGLSIIYVNMEQFEKGEAELEVLLQREPDDPGVNNDLGYLYADQGKNLEKAESMIRKAITAEPDNTAYLDSFGWVLFRRGKLKEAAEPLERAAKDPTADSTIHDHLGDVYFKLQLLDKARESWQKAAKLAGDPKPPDKRLAEIRKKLESIEKLDRSLTQPPGPGPNP